MMKKSVPANQQTRTKSLGAISPYKVTNIPWKKEKGAWEEAAASSSWGIFCHSPVTGAWARTSRKESEE